MDSIFIEGLAIDTLIGIYPGERDARQSVVLDLRLDVNPSPSAASGRIEDALDYAAVVAALNGFVGNSDYALLEQLAEACCAMLRQAFTGIHAIDLRLDKPAAARALGCRHVGVHIQRRYA